MMFDYHKVFDDWGKSPASPEEWQKATITHDYLWMFNVTSDFTERLMQSYFNDHKDANRVAKEMELFIEELQRQTGLSSSQTAEYAILGKYIYDDREFRDSPGEARQLAWEAALRSEGGDDEFLPPEVVTDELMQMAEEFTDMLNERRRKAVESEIELTRLEMEMELGDVDSVIDRLNGLLNNNNLPNGENK